MQRVLGNFVIFSLMIVLIAGVYIWLVNHRQVGSLDYIQDMEWAEWHSISPKIQSTGIYDGMVDKHGHIHLLWLEYNKEIQAGQLFHTEVNTSGTVLQEAEVILTNQRLSDVSLIFHHGNMHLFWIGGGEDHRLDLMYTRFDHDGHKLMEQQVLAGAFTKVEDLQATISPTGEYMLTWVDEVDGVKQVQAIWLAADTKPKVEPQQITWAEHGSFRPNLIADTRGSYHLVWLEKYPPVKNLAIKDYNMYNLYYQTFDATGQPTHVPQMLDNVVLNLPQLAITHDRLYITWNKVLPYQKQTLTSFEQLLPKYRIFGLEVQLSDPVHQGSVVDLTGEGVAFYQSLALDSVGQLHMVYYRLINDQIFLTQETYTKGFGRVKPSTRLFPNHEILFSEGQIELKYGTLLLPDPTKGVHLIWFNSSSTEGDHYYYSNTTRPATISPLQVIGIDKQRMIESIVMGLFYALGLAILGVFGNTWVFTAVAAGLMFWLIRLGQKVPQLSRLNNPYLATVILCLLNFLFTLLHLQDSYYWQLYTGWRYLGAIFIIVSMVTAIFVYVNKANTKPVVLAGFTSLFWIYWLNVVSLVFAIPGMVF